MADTSLVLANVRAALYDELGGQNADLPNVAGGILDRQLKYATRRLLSQIAHTRTGEDVLVGTFDTVADQQTYAVPDDRQVVQVFWGPSGTTDVPSDLYARQFGQIPGSSLMDGALSPGFFWRSDQVIHDMKQRQIESRYKWDLLNGYIYLYPVPNGVSTVRYLYYSETGSVTDLDTVYEQPLILLAAAFCARVMANRFRGQGTPFTQGGITESASSQEWDARYEHYMDAYHVAIQEIME